MSGGDAGNNDPGIACFDAAFAALWNDALGTASHNATGKESLFTAGNNASSNDALGIALGTVGRNAAGGSIL